MAIVVGNHLGALIALPAGYYSDDLEGGRWQCALTASLLGLGSALAGFIAVMVVVLPVTWFPSTFFPARKPPPDAPYANDFESMWSGGEAGRSWGHAGQRRCTGGRGVFGRGRGPSLLVCGNLGGGQPGVDRLRGCQQPDRQAAQGHREGDTLRRGRICSGVLLLVEPVTRTRALFQPQWPV
ncbi:MAG TPA: hypothetical protein VN621_02300 [Arthrobacter sp.]|nr:hypothetical protein [Arthrobacter sp.]